MRNIIYRHRKIRLFVLMVALGGAGLFYLQEPRWVSGLAEEKVSHFMGHRLKVEIGGVSGGVFRDMTLEDVAFISGADNSKVFRLERMEISYRLWWVLLEKLGVLPEEDKELKYVGVYFSEENPFARGFLKLYSYPDRFELFGSISPVLFGDEKKKGVKGVFTRRADGTYDCDLLWDGKTSVTGTLDPAGRAIDLGFVPLAQKKGIVKIKGSIADNNDIQVYSRLDKVDLFGTELIGDIWLSYRDPGTPTFLARAENLVVNKLPFWGFVVGGYFSPRDKELHLDNVKWGESFTLTGRMKMEEPYPAQLKLAVKDLDINEMAAMFGNTTVPYSGRAEAEVELAGPIRTADVKGRIYIGKGVLNTMEFRSVFATLEGKLPVIRIADSRVLKDGGYILISGEMDFSRHKENKIFEGVKFDTDNKVAVWEDWQITKEEDANQVEARRDNVTIITSTEDDNLRKKSVTEDPIQKELGFNYKIDGSNSIKIETKEDDDFFGLEHKIQF